MKESNDVPVLTRTEEGLALVSGEQVLMGDFTRLLPRLKRASKLWLCANFSKIVV